jgi:hypothetical protein
MLSFDEYQGAYVTRPYDSALQQIDRTVISRHLVKAGFDYPTIRLPHTFSMLAGLSTRIYQTLHDGAFAFLVVVAGSGSSPADTSEDSESPALT